MAKENHVKTVSITHYYRSPITKLSDCVLLNGSNESPVQGGDASTKISQLSVMEVLYHVVYKMMGTKSAKSKLKTSDAVLSKLS